ncbi:MAG: hypothetical protein JO253_03600 [Alphaproteobacteria bacterium]|nr:hypothetical protein [Alphaproteobacteria bacterium]
MAEDTIVPQVSGGDGPDPKPTEAVSTPQVSGGDGPNPSAQAAAIAPVDTTTEVHPAHSLLDQFEADLSRFGSYAEGELKQWIAKIRAAL